jgi:hypothetical protein
MIQFLLLTKHYGDQIKVETGRTFSMHVRNEKCIQNLVGKFEGNNPLARPRRRRYDHTKM